MLLLNPEQHLDLHFTPIDNAWLTFARSPVPLVLQDLDALQGRYPIVISPHGTPVPLLLPELLQPHQAAPWDNYTPNQLQAYPFHLIQQPVIADDGSTVEIRESLAIDEHCPHLQLRAGYRLFDDDGQLTSFTRSIIDRLHALAQAQSRTERFMRTLERVGVMVPARVYHQGECFDCRLIDPLRLDRAMEALDSEAEGLSATVLAHRLLDAQERLEADQVRWLTQIEGEKGLHEITIMTGENVDKSTQPVQ
ncbi:hypothetical protein ABIE61_003739 [Marinobacterium sp. MBR-111]|uniref:SapC family protein n=1 Tax=Marinobacterium sp. MBR-111 TaxID=3156463 RepID=UPI003393A2DD